MYERKILAPKINVTLSDVDNEFSVATTLLHTTNMKWNQRQVVYNHLS